MKSKWNCRGVCVLVALAMCLTVFAAGCDEQDVERVIAGVDAVVNHDGGDDVNFSDWLEQEWEHWF